MLAERAWGGLFVQKALALPPVLDKVVHSLEQGGRVSRGSCALALEEKESHCCPHKPWAEIIPCLAVCSVVSALTPACSAVESWRFWDEEKERTEWIWTHLCEQEDLLVSQPCVTTLSECSRGAGAYGLLAFCPICRLMGPPRFPSLSPAVLSRSIFRVSGFPVPVASGEVTTWGSCSICTQLLGHNMATLCC